MTENSSSETLAPLDSFMKNMEELDALRAVYSHVSANPLINPEDMEGKTYDNDIMYKIYEMKIINMFVIIIVRFVTAPRRYGGKHEKSNKTASLLQA